MDYSHSFPWLQGDLRRIMRVLRSSLTDRFFYMNFFLVGVPECLSRVFLCPSSHMQISQQSGLFVTEVCLNVGCHDIQIQNAWITMVCFGATCWDSKLWLNLSFRIPGSVYGGSSCDLNLRNVSLIQALPPSIKLQLQSRRKHLPFPFTLQLLVSQHGKMRGTPFENLGPRTSQDSPTNQS